MTRPRSLAVLSALLWWPVLAGEMGGGRYGVAKPADSSATIASSSAGAGGFRVRGKWFSSAVSLPAGDAWRNIADDATLVDHNADLRLMWRGEAGRLRFRIHHSVTAVGGEAAAFGRTFGMALEQTPTDDGKRLFDLTWELAKGADIRLLHRFDRLAIDYRSSRWALAIGRQAVSWGSGMVFQPMDFLNPFAPTSVDQDYKPGDDMARLRMLFDNHHQFEAIVVGGRVGEDANRSASSVGAKYEGGVGDAGFELIGARHRGDTVFGLGLQAGVRAGFVRANVVWTKHDGGTAVSGVLNADCSLEVLGKTVHLFGEYHRNGFGMRRLPPDLRTLPEALRARRRRGELFTLMRDYAAVGARFRWHLLATQSASLITNLRDGSHVLQVAFTYDPSDDSRVHAGFLKPFGGVGDEFGRGVLGQGMTSGGASQAFARLVYYF